jgi:hypothetical protein
MEHASLDQRGVIHESGWHWGEGVQHSVIHDLPALQKELTESSGIKGLEVIDPAERGYALRAAKIFLRDGFVCIKDALTPEHLASLREFCEGAMLAVVGADEFGGAKGAWRYMFGGSSITGSCMHTPAYAQLAALPTVDPVLTEIWGTPEFVCCAHPSILSAVWPPRCRVSPGPHSHRPFSLADKLRAVAL